MKTSRQVLLKKAWQLIRQYWKSEEKWRAWGLLIAIIALNLGIVYIHVAINSWQAGFYEFLQQRDQSGFISAITEFSGLAATFILVAGYQIYLRMMLQIRWRRWLTDKYLSHWLKHRNYYRMTLDPASQTDNPDQRISEDLNLLVTRTLQIGIGLMEAVVTLVSFIFILWNLSGELTVPFGDQSFVIPGYLVWAALIYSSIGTWLTAKLGGSLAKLNFFQQKYEADFRFSLMRLRENSESIALYQGEGQEKGYLAGRFQEVVGNYWRIMKLNKQLMWLTSGYNQVSIIFGILVASPRYFSGQIHLGQMFQITNAYSRVHESLSFIINSFTEIAEWMAVVERLTQFIDHMEKSRQVLKKQDIRYVTLPEQEFQVGNLSVFRPDGEVLLKEVSFSLQSGQSLLITGPSGAGKSTLIRSLAGIWPYCHGTLTETPAKRAMFLPQKSYMPVDTLRQALIYPGHSASVEDEQLKQYLNQFGLRHLTQRLDEIEQWGQVLSLGEQQRIALIRVLLQKPKWIFMDEATSALDEVMEQRFYSTIKEALPQSIIVSVGHRSTLQQFHNHFFSLEELGNWQISTKKACL